MRCRCSPSENTCTLALFSKVQRTLHHRCAGVLHKFIWNSIPEGRRGLKTTLLVDCSHSIQFSISGGRAGGLCPGNRTQAFAAFYNYMLISPHCIIAGYVENLRGNIIPSINLVGYVQVLFRLLVTPVSAGLIGIQPLKFLNLYLIDFLGLPG